MRKAFWKLMFWLFGLKVVGDFPQDLKKTIIVTAPHTSNWDFIAGLGVRRIKGFFSYFMIKDSWLKKPIVGWILKKAGGVGIDRSRNMKMTDQIAEVFDERDYFIITITPEGTRKYNPDWKTGFWHIAKKANIPLLPITLNWGEKCFEIKEPFELTDDKEADVERLKAVFRGIKGKNPEWGVK